MVKKKKPDDIEELSQEDIFGEGGDEDNSMTPQEYREMPHEQPPSESTQLARIKIADKIIDTPPERLSEMSWIPKGMLVSIVLKKTANYLTSLPKDGKVKMRASDYMIEQMLRCLRGVDGRLISRATVLAGDESRAKDDEDKPWDSI